MKPRTTTLNFCLAVLAISLSLVILPIAIIGDHRITEGMQPKNKEIPAFSLSFNSSQQLIYLSGTLDIGVVSEFENLLNTYPNAIGVVLESAGGNIYQARGLANIIMYHELDTYSFSYCYSACTIVYIAGKDRYAHAAAELGFHSYSLEPNFMQPYISIQHEQAKDLQFFEKQIPDQIFVQKIFQHKSNELWIPNIAELLKAGVIHEILQYE